MIKMKEIFLEKFLEKSGQNGEDALSLCIAMNVILFAIFIHPHFIIFLPIFALLFWVVDLFSYLSEFICGKINPNREVAWYMKDVKTIKDVFTSAGGMGFRFYFAFIFLFVLLVILFYVL